VVSRRSLLAALAAALVFALQPAAAGQAGLDDSANPGCPIARGVPSAIGQVIQVSGSLTCWRPGGSSGARFGTNVAPANVQQRLPNPKLGDPCQDTIHYPVAFTNDTAGDAHAQFSFAGGATGGSFPEGSQYFSADDALKMATNDAYVTDVQLGTYERSDAADPNSQLTCQLNPTFHFLCPDTGQIDQFCLSWLPHPITADALRPRAWGPFFAQRLGSIAGQAGTIVSAPSQKGVVNTPTCFWIEGMGIPVEEDLMLVLPSAPDESGRMIFYTFLAKIRFLGVDWNFDDPAGNQQDLTDPTPGPCQGRPNLAMHKYPQISDGRNPDNTYHVSAVERYSITVDAFWVDSAGAHGPIPVDPGVAAPAISPVTYPQFVGQVEGIPIGAP
jgi:hypothetical protein